MKVSYFMFWYKFFFGALLIALLWIIFACNDAPFHESIVKSLPEFVDFNYHIKPILSDRCYTCHGPDEEERKADLRLDTEEGALSAFTEEGRVIHPNKPNKSTLFSRIISRDDNYKMPPPESKLELEEEEIAMIHRWIVQGAQWKEHWSFTKPRLPLLTNNDHSKTHSEIDRFIRKELQSRGLNFSDRADKETLLRRITLDLTGLPPSSEEMNEFLADKSEKAYELVIDRLLGSPGYGERMASAWMDAARYADTHGYLDDTHREVWQWRNWVIDAFNDNLSYDNFIVWQLAGDLLPEATKEQKIATAFNRLHRQNQEGGVLPEEYRAEYIADRVHTTATAFMGMTMACARCHDHKFDPISQKDFYSMAAFFNSSFEIGRAPIGYESGPTMLLTEDIEDAKIKAVKEVISLMENEVEGEKAIGETEFEKWLSEGGGNVDPSKFLQKNLQGHFDFNRLHDSKFRNLALPSHARIAGWSKEHLQGGLEGSAVSFEENNAVFFTGLGNFERTDEFSFSFWINIPEFVDEASILANAHHKWHGYRGYELRIEDGRLLYRITNIFPQNALQIESLDQIPTDEWVHIGIVYDGSSTAEGMKLYLNGNKMNEKIVHNRLFKSIRHNSNNKMVVMPYTGLTLGKRAHEKSILGGMVDEFRIYNRMLASVEMKHLANAFQPKNDIESYSSHPNDEELHEWYFIHHFRSSIKSKLKEARERENELLTPISEVMVMEDMDKEVPTFVLNRGQYDKPQQEVIKGTPDAILPFTAKFAKNRLGLAKWLVDKEHPLTSRVAVNRIWQMLFGKGLVRTPEDFGNQGALPSHPELLDWLAVTFVSSGWNVKDLIKRIALSSTYCQSSVVSQKMKDIDPENIYYARAPRYRLPAEMIRDQALAASDLLVDQVGGESIKPYQPEGLWTRQAFQNWTKYEQDKDDNLYRRTMYIYWKRNTPHPYLTTFDIPDRSSCSMKRINTNSPTQALMLMNYPQFSESARALSEVVLQMEDLNLEEKLAMIYKRLICKSAGPDQIELMKTLFLEERSRFQKEPDAAHQFLTVGEYRADSNLDQFELAALTVVSHSLMNSVNFYMKT